MIEKTVLLPCSPDRAFVLLTEHAGSWWPADRRHTKDPASSIRIERDGPFYERAADGTEAELGVVRVFEPGRRLLLDWYPGTGPTAPTRVEIVLAAEGVGTRVRLTHREGPDSASYEKKAGAFDRSWDLVLAAWLEAVGRA